MVFKQSIPSPNSNQPHSAHPPSLHVWHLSLKKDYLHIFINKFFYKIRLLYSSQLERILSYYIFKIFLIAIFKFCKIKNRYNFFTATISPSKYNIITIKSTIIYHLNIVLKIIIFINYIPYNFFTATISLSKYNIFTIELGIIYHLNIVLKFIKN